MKRVRFFISGKVHGVCYRFCSAKKAKELGVKGFVKNLPDGRVELVVEGENNKVKDFITFCKNNPGHSKVESLELGREEEVKIFLFKDFKIEYG